MKTLHNIKKSPRSVRTSKRVGRGNATGKGTYSGRGMKGQRSRSGGKSGLAARGMKSYLLRIPKSRGFNAAPAKYTIINISALQKVFKDGDSVTLKSLKSRGLIDKNTRFVKILSHGDIKKKLTVSAHKFSEQAKKSITKVGGIVNEIKLPEIKEKAKITKEKSGK